MGYGVKAIETIVIENGKDKIVVDGDLLNKATLTLRAVKHPLRKQIVELIDKNKSMTVTEIFVSLRIEQSVASQHLAVLRKAGWLLTERRGKFIYYGINYSKFNEIGDILSKMV